MAWAERKSDRQVVNVWMLSRAETGLACGCVCAGCGAVLEAVNAGQPAAHFESETPVECHSVTKQGLNVVTAWVRHRAQLCCTRC